MAYRTLLLLFAAGEDSGRIVIWNMAPVVSEKIENDENVPKMLCQMDNHLGR
jgi:protein HIRA/HIR1